MIPVVPPPVSAASRSGNHTSFSFFQKTVFTLWKTEKLYANISAANSAFLN
jgi:hypothetical protein